MAEAWEWGLLSSVLAGFCSEWRSPTVFALHSRLVSSSTGPLLPLSNPHRQPFHPFCSLACFYECLHSNPLFTLLWLEGPFANFYASQVGLLTSKGGNDGDWCLAPRGRSAEAPCPPSRSPEGLGLGGVERALLPSNQQVSPQCVFLMGILGGLKFP